MARSRTRKGGSRQKGGVMNWLFGSSTAQKLPNSGQPAITPGTANTNASNVNSMNNPFVNNTRKSNAVTLTPVNASKQNPQRDLDFREVWSAYRVFYNKRNRFMRKYNLTELDQSEKDLIDDAKLKQESLEKGRKNGSVAEDVYLYRKFERGQQTMKRGLATLGSASTAAQQRIALGARGIGNLGQSIRQGLQTRRVERRVRPGSVAALPAPVAESPAPVAQKPSTNPFNEFI